MTGRRPGFALLSFSLAMLMAAGVLLATQHLTSAGWIALVITAVPGLAFGVYLVRRSGRSAEEPQSSGPSGHTPPSSRGAGDFGADCR